jgi:hypothetical protein
MADTFTTEAPAISESNYKQLRNLIHAIAISILILTGTVFIFIYREVVLVRRQTTELLAGIAELDRANTQRFIDELRGKLGDYARQHPDFVPIYIKYFGTNPPPANVSGPVPIPTNSPAQPGPK